MKQFWETGTCLSQDNIRRYLREEITDAERHHVERHLVDCQLCSAALVGYAAEEEETTEEDLQELYRQRPYTEANPSRKVLAPIWWRVAAAVLLLLVMGSGWWYYQQAKTERIYATYMDPVPIHRFEDVRVISKAPGTNPHLILALQAFEAKQYDRAAAAFRTYLDEGTNDKRVHLYLGISHLMQGHTQQAAAHLDTVIWQNPTLVSEALWYKSLAKLREGDKENGKALLESIRKRGEDRSTEAGIILKKL